MTFPITLIITMKNMRPESFRQMSLVSKYRENLCKKVLITTPFKAAL